MSYFSQNLLPLVIFLPLVFAVLVALLPAGERGQIRGLALIGMVADLILALALYLGYSPQGPELQMEIRARWLDALGISFHLGVDGLAVSLILLTAFLGPLVVLASTYAQERVKELHLSLLVLQAAMMGALASLDLIVFYIFWEAMLIPMYLLIGVWGSEQRQMAAVKFFLYTLAGSLLMLVAVLAVYFISQPAGPRSFDYAEIYNALISANRELSRCYTETGCGALSPLAQSLRTFGPLLFFAFALAFAIKVPMFPVHTWLPDAHVQAPVAGSMILAGVMLKMGTFGFWRFAFPLFPAVAREARPWIAGLALVGIVYGALMCLAQRDVKKLIAYSSVSHLGFCMLGMAAMTVEAATGSAYQMLSHGISTGALFLLFGMLYERRHTRLMSDFGGIAKVMPAFAALFLITTFASVAVPGTNGFIGEFLVLVGTFKSSLPLWTGAVAGLAIILGATYMLWMVQRVFFGQLTHRENGQLRDLTLREWVTAAPLVVMALWMGLYPQPFLERLEPAAGRFVSRAMAGAPDAAPDEELQIQVMPLPSGEPPAQPPKLTQASSGAEAQLP